MTADFYLPTRVVFGAGVLEQLGKLAASLGQRALLVTSPGSWQRSGTPQRARKSLQQAGLQVTVFAQVKGEADLDTITAGLDALETGACDVVIGLGGGSPIDTAKAIAGLARLDGDIRAYHAGQPPERPGLPIIAVPTTAGSGAEATRNAVLTDHRTNLKTSIRGDTWFPRIALVDPELTVSMDTALTANTGSDALCQAIEAYTSIAANDVTDSLAERAIALLSRNLAAACHDGQDIRTREAMSMGSLLSGMAMSNARLGGVHGMAHPLGAHYHIAHGMVCGLLLPYTMQYNLEYALEKYARIAEMMDTAVAGEPVHTRAERAVTAIRGLLREIGIPEHLGPFGVQADGLQRIIDETMPSGSTKHNARPLQQEDVRQILLAAL